MIQDLRPRFKRNRKGGSPRPATAQARRLALLGLAVTGLGVCLYLTALHRRLIDDPAEPLACAISQALDCEPVLRSAFATIAGTPLAAFGAWFYAAVSMLAVANLRRSTAAEPRRSLSLALLLAGGVATLTSATLALVSLLWLHTLCPLCAGLYLIGGAILALAWIEVRQAEPSIRTLTASVIVHWRRRKLRAATIVVAALSTLGALPLLHSLASNADSPLCATMNRVNEAPGASLRLEVYSDFQCPFCRQLDRQLRTLRGRPRIEIVHHQYPLDAACNPWVKRTRHPGACLQAQAAICAGRAGHYDEFSDRLFDDGTTGSEDLVELATSIGIDRAQFAACLISPDSAEWIAGDIREGKRRGVRGTPTVVVDGVARIGPLAERDLRCLADTPAIRDQSYRLKPGVRQREPTKDRAAVRSPSAS